MYTYYLKKCGFQELGSVEDDGVVHRGRYLLTSMSQDILSIFPPLSRTQKNDSALIPIIALYSGKKVYCNFVYHNDKFHGSTAAHPRNEYRLYLNNALENNELYFKTDDIIILRKAYIEEDGQTETIYPMDVIKNIHSPIYKELNSIIMHSEFKGNYGVYNGKINNFEDKFDAISSNGEPTVEIDESVTRRVNVVDENAVENLFNSSSFRDFIMVGYERLCAVTKTVIKHENYMNLEAAHIKPRSHGGNFLPNNGIAMSRDIHWAFDKGFFSLDDNLDIIVHDMTTSEYLHSFQGKQIKIPSNPFFAPEISNVKYHRENIYGLFLTSGRL